MFCLQMQNVPNPMHSYFLISMFVCMCVCGWCMWLRSPENYFQVSRILVYCLEFQSIMENCLDLLLTATWFVIRRNNVKHKHFGHILYTIQNPFSINLLSLLSSSFQLGQSNLPQIPRKHIFFVSYRRSITGHWWQPLMK